MKFVPQMTPQERVAARAAHTRLLGAALEEPCDVLILDEACAAASLMMVEEPLLGRLCAAGRRG